MARKARGFVVAVHEPTKVKTSIGRGMLSLNKMINHKRRAFKKYRGQGKRR